MGNEIKADSWSDDDLDDLIVHAIRDKADAASAVLWEAVERNRAVAVANNDLIEAATFRKNAAMAEAERIKERIKFHLQARDLKTLECRYGKFSRTANGGHNPMRITGDFPDEFARIKRECDLDKVRAALKEGELLDFVAVLDRGEHLRMN